MDELFKSTGVVGFIKTAFFKFRLLEQLPIFPSGKLTPFQKGSVAKFENHLPVWYIFQIFPGSYMTQDQFKGSHFPKCIVLFRSMGHSEPIKILATKPNFQINETPWTYKKLYNRTTNLRIDIQALRGYAVLIILLFHAGIGPFKAGHLGVDIFFVISGFLITGMIVRGVQDHSFSFRTFYYKRAKRLLPAAYTVLFLTIIGGYFFLTSIEYNNLKNQVLGALTFSINFTLRDQADYFEGTAEFKPLLHMWSLAIEEQFYLLLPLMLYFIPQKRWKAFLIIGFILSLLSCLILVNYYPRDVFYYLPTRAWELGIGGIGAFILLNKQSDGIPHRYRGVAVGVFLTSLAVLFILPVTPITSLHPSVDAVLVCCATMVIILGQYPIAQLSKWGSFPLRMLGKMGDYSYSLYLVHWPLYAFATNAYMGGEIPLSVRVDLLVLTFILAISLYHFIENPIHRKTYEHPKRVVLAFFVTAIGLAGLMLGVQSQYRKTNYREILRSNTGLARKCDQNTAHYHQFPECATSDAPQLLVWGDSFAMHFVPGLQEQTQKTGIVQVTKSACAPFLHRSITITDKYTKEWAKECISFNNEVVETLKTMPSVKYVVLSTQLFNWVQENNTGLLQNKDGSFSEISMGEATALEGLQATVSAIHRLGKKVVFISPMVYNNYDIGQCLERKETAKITLGPHKNCDLPYDAVQAYMAPVFHFLIQAKETMNIGIINLADDLCDGTTCLTTIGRTFLYRDKQHISCDGSVKIAEYLNLYQRIKDTAH